MEDGLSLVSAKEKLRLSGKLFSVSVAFASLIFVAFFCCCCLLC